MKISQLYPWKKAEVRKMSNTHNKSLKKPSTLPNQHEWSLNSLVISKHILMQHDAKQSIMKQNYTCTN